jgi:hypothetical protein
MFTNFSQQQLITIKPQPLSHLNHSPTNTLPTCSAYNISARTAQKSQFLCYCLQAAVLLRPLYSHLFRNRYVAIGLHATIIYNQVIAPFGPLKVNSRFGRICRLHFEGRRLS